MRQVTFLVLLYSKQVLKFDFLNNWNLLIYLLAAMKGIFFCLPEKNSPNVQHFAMLSNEILGVMMPYIVQLSILLGVYVLFVYNHSSEKNNVQWRLISPYLVMKY